MKKISIAISALIKISIITLLLIPFLAPSATADFIKWHLDDVTSGISFHGPAVGYDYTIPEYNTATGTIPDWTFIVTFSDSSPVAASNNGNGSLHFTIQNSSVIGSMLLAFRNIAGRLLVNPFMSEYFETKQHGSPKFYLLLFKDLPSNGLAFPRKLSRYNDPMRRYSRFITGINPMLYPDYCWTAGYQVSGKLRGAPVLKPSSRLLCGSRLSRNYLECLNK